ncbi:hypothetical protein FOPG_17613 [Fusarium oxysporum f. sp. conglutinans race 2 54008]|uniref:Uncharacterized protein n=1 Tax=Fusarium oxysporum f. sp. conglutinans race 2 54008 TaxID=1089457 RepID=X0H2C9_FUSOX|nr:hypothetical protein FOPG_17613 [Fusarium oxysporum f. sp. conglutinans race 2 54008]
MRCSYNQKCPCRRSCYRWWLIRHTCGSQSQRCRRRGCRD